MWIKNNAIRQKAQNKSDESNYLIVNTENKNPALRVSEKAKLALGWDKGDYVNVYVDEDRIMLLKDNNAKEFPLRIYKSRDKNYGFNLYGQGIKEICKKFGWHSKRDYPVEIVDSGGEKMLICFKAGLLTATEKAILETTKYRQKESFKMI